MWYYSIVIVYNNIFTCMSIGCTHMVDVVVTNVMVQMKPDASGATASAVYTLSSIAVAWRERFMLGRIICTSTCGSITKFEEKSF